MTRKSIYIYLTTLAVFDSLVLLVGLLRLWLGELSGSDIRNSNRWLCKSIITAGYTCSDVSVWLIVAVTVERYIVVCHPLKTKHFCKTMRAKKAVLMILLVFSLINFHLLFTTDLVRPSDSKSSVLAVDPHKAATAAALEREEGQIGEEVEEGVGGGNVKSFLVVERDDGQGSGHGYKCGAVPGQEVLVSHIWPWVDALLYGFGPSMLISLFNGFIIQKMCRASRVRDLLSCQSSSEDTPSVQDKRDVRLTCMLMVVSFTFVLTTLPANIASIIASTWINSESSSDLTKAKGILFGTCATLLMYLNHSINFLLYCVTGQKFRAIVCRMFMKCFTCAKCSAPETTPVLDHSRHLYCSRKTGGRGPFEGSRSSNSQESQF